MIYLLQPNDYPVVKIGTSDNPEARMKQLHINHWADFKIIRTIEGGYGEERWFHQRFAEHRIRGEWFTLIPEMLTVAISAEEVRQQRLSPDQRRRVAEEAIRAGRSYSDIGEELGISRERVRQYAEKLGIKGDRSVAKARARQAAAEQRRLLKKAEAAAALAANHERFMELVGQGFSFSRAAKILGFNASHGHKWAIMLGLVARHSKWQHDLAERKGLAVRLVQEGQTYADAGRATRLCYPTIRAALRAAEQQVAA